MNITHPTGHALVQSMKSFVQGDISAEEFKNEFMALWRRQRDCEEFKENELLFYEAIDRVFTALDCFCADETLRDATDISDDELHGQVIDALDSLDDSASGLSSSKREI